MPVAEQGDFLDFDDQGLPGGGDGYTHVFFNGCLHNFLEPGEALAQAAGLLRNVRDKAKTRCYGREKGREVEERSFCFAFLFECRGETGPFTTHRSRGEEPGSVLRGSAVYVPVSGDDFSPACCRAPAPASRWIAWTCKRSADRTGVNSSQSISRPYMKYSARLPENSAAGGIYLIIVRNAALYIARARVCGAS